MKKELLEDFWFDNVSTYYKDTKRISDEEREFLNYMKTFQEGDFSNKTAFLDFVFHSCSRDIFVVGMRLFLTIATHEDFVLFIHFFEECEEDELRVFLAFVRESMSIQVIPYLVTLYEDWEETPVATQIAGCICDMLGEEFFEDEEYDAEELVEMFDDFKENNDLNKYYYYGEEFSLGNLTKEMISIMMDCKQRNQTYYAGQISSILSNITGIKCPIVYGDEITDEKVANVYNYVKEISNMKMEKGRKYFYDKLID